MAAKVGLDAALSLVEQRDTLAATAAALGCRWLPLAARGSLLAVDEPQRLGRRDDGDALEGFEGE
jgi:hypothetical protein